MADEIKKIIAISLADKKRYRAYAFYNGEFLSIKLITEIKGIFNLWKKPLIEEIKARNKTHYIIVEEKTDHISKHAIPFSFDDFGDDGRINYYMAIDWYKALENLGLLQLPTKSTEFKKDFKAGFSDEIIDPQQDEKGRVKYNIDWSRFTGVHRVILLCVYAAMYDEMTENYLEEMFGHLGEPLNNNDPLRPFKAITTEYDKKVAKEWNMRDLASQGIEYDLNKKY